MRSRPERGQRVDQGPGPWRQSAAGSPARRLLGGCSAGSQYPRRELPSGEAISVRMRLPRPPCPDRGTEWDDAELGVVPGLREVGYQDAFRALHGYAANEPSWTWRRIAAMAVVGVWIISSRRRSFARLQRCITTWRDQGLSHHSPLEVDLHEKICLLGWTERILPRGSRSAPDRGGSLDQGVWPRGRDRRDCSGLGVDQILGLLAADRGQKLAERAATDARDLHLRDTDLMPISCCVIWSTNRRRSTCHSRSSSPARQPLPRPRPGHSPAPLRQAFDQGQRPLVLRTGGVERRVRRA